MEPGTPRSANKDTRSTKSTSGRVTPRANSDSRRPAASARYTPPTHEVYTESPRWVLILMAVLFGLGFLVLILNYADALPKLPLVGEAGGPGYLILGLGLITGGFVTASQYR